MQITEQILLNNYFTKFSDPIFKELKFEPYGFEGIYFEKSIENNNYFITITYCPQLSTRANKNWHIHVDNCDRDSIGNLYVNTVEEINKFFDLLEINYKLK